MTHSFITFFWLCDVDVASSDITQARDEQVC